MLLIPNTLLSKENKDYKINGKVTGSSGAKAYLVDVGIFYRLIDNGIILDSCEIKNDHIEFKGNIEFPMICAIKIPELTKAYRLFVLESGMTVFNGDVEKLHFSTVISEGSENKLWDEYNSRISSVDEKLGFISEHRNSVVSLHILDILLFSSKVDKAVAEKCYSKLSDKIRTSPTGKIVGKRIEQVASVNATKLPPFEGNDINGKKISFEEFKGKYVIIDFWATWCQPCVEDMPKMVEFYGNHKDSVEIISVSLDRNIDLCQRKIQELGMVWRHICNGDGTRGELPLLYNVDSVPRVVIYDMNREIIYDSAFSDKKFYDVVDNLIKAD